MRSSPKALALVLLALPAAAVAYETNNFWWDWQDHAIEDPFTIEPTSFPGYIGDDSEIVDALTRAMSTWNDAGYDVNLEYGGLATHADATYDDDFNIHWSDDWDDMGGALAFAATWAYEDGAAFNCDIVFMGHNDYGTVTWTVDGASGSDAPYDIEAVGLHELGHCVGFDHDSGRIVMNAYYNGLTALTGDEQSGLSDMFGRACNDADGDGYLDCDSDCDDDDASKNPGAGEVCDGVDNDCDGVVDEDGTQTVEIGSAGWSFDDSWVAVGHVFEVTQATTLQSARMRLQADEGSRVVWAIYVTDSIEGPWELVRTDISYTNSTQWQDSPTLDLPMEAGRVYSVSAGVEADLVTAWYRNFPSTTERGPINLLGSLYQRALADGNNDYPVDKYTAWAFEGDLFFDAFEDEDGDGQTELCGDCAPDDASVYRGATEVCDGADNDCDGSIDEGFSGDSDGDGVSDCVDPCPDDAADDSDHDGSCDSDDPCPDDRNDDSDGDGSCDGDDPCPDDPTDSCAETDDPCAGGACDTGGGTDSGTPVDGDGSKDPGGCGCSSGAAPAGLLWLVGLAAVRRRRG